MFNANNNNRTDSQTDIAKRLKELTKLQEKQTQQLKERQDKERQVFSVHHPNMNNILDKLHPDEEANSDLEYNKSEPNLGVINVVIKSRPENEKSAVCKRSPVNMPPKRTFLKRGEGLKQRFKIDPQAFRLENLPKYKYANAHANLSLKKTAPAVRKQVSQPEEKKPTEKQKVSIVEVPPSPMDLAFQKILFSAHNVYNSTPDVKSSTCTSTLADTQAGLRREIGAGDHNESLGVQPLSMMTWHKLLDSQQLVPIRVGEMRSSDSGAPDNDEDGDTTDLFELLEKKALEGSFDMNSSCIKQFMQRRKESKHTDDSDVIPVQERLKQTGLSPQVAEVIPDDDDSSADDDESNGDDVESRGDDDEFSDDDQLPPEKPEMSTLTGDEKSSLAEHKNARSKMHVRFSEENSTLEYEYEQDSEQVDEEDTQEELSHEPASEIETTLTGSNNSVMQDVKKLFFEMLQQRALADDGSVASSVENSPQPSTRASDENNCSSLVSSSRENAHSGYLEQPTEQLKQRLSELEAQIAMFQQKYSELTKALQEHELAKAMFEQDRLDAEDRFKDEKIKIEMHLHDERMKLEADRRKMEEKYRMAMTNSKDRKEVQRLKQEMEALMLQQKQKDQEHAAAQARLRVQVKNLEKDHKALHEDIERLNRENKRLQMEVAKISRENNNKMLQEINRNIAKLAPKVQTPEETSARSKKSTASSKSLGKLSQKSRQSCRPSENVQKRFLFDDEEVLVSTPRESHRSDNGDNESDEEIMHAMLSPRKKEPSVRKSLEPSKPKNSEMSDDKSVISANSDTNNNNNNDNENINANNDSIDYQRKITNEDGSFDIWYANGNLKKISPDGMLVRMLYFNNDIKETDINEGTVKYYYAASNVWHTSYLDGLEILEFPTGQKEHRHKNGIVETHFPDNSVKKTNPNDEYAKEEWTYADGTTMLRLRNDDTIVMFANGQKEIRTKLHKRREYPDGTVKLVYPDGSQETRYSNGRVRLKDKDGNLLLDSERSKC